jgi:energy-converting hydrogenase Eha subunit B
MLSALVEPYQPAANLHPVATFRLNGGGEISLVAAKLLFGAFASAADPGPDGPVAAVLSSTAWLSLSSAFAREVNPEDLVLGMFMEREAEDVRFTLRGRSSSSALRFILALLSRS